MTGTVFDIKELGIHDGPGLRTTVFLKGCPLRCIWCHNPEGLSPKPQLSIRTQGCLQCGLCQKPCSHPECQPFHRCLHICPNGLLSVSGKQYTAAELAERLKRNEMFWGDEGGITFSGGEPLLQADFLHAVLDALGNVSVAIETSGYADTATFTSIIKRMNFVYMDLKLADEQLHRKFTGVSNSLILKNLEVLRTQKIPCMIRTPLIPGITDTPENLSAIEKLVGDLPHELLPYNAMAGAKYPMFRMDYPYERYLAEI